VLEKKENFNILALHILWIFLSCQQTGHPREIFMGGTKPIWGP